MEYLDNNIKSYKNKHLNKGNREYIELRLSQKASIAAIAKEMGKSRTTIYNEIKRGTVEQIKEGKKIRIYLADAGQAKYEESRRNSCNTKKYLKCSAFIKYAASRIKNDNWSPDACFGEALANNRFTRNEMVCTKTLYEYIDLGLLDIKNIDLPLKLRRNTRNDKVKENKKNLGQSIDERPIEINNREEFGHWEIDTVVGEKYKTDNVLLTMVERKTRYTIVLKINAKNSSSVMDNIHKMHTYLGDKFAAIFKSITSDNGSEFADLAKIENLGNTKVYFTHPYSSFERGTNERHNGLLRRFIPKGERISDYSIDDIAFIEDWMNTLPRKILKYKTPEELFNFYLDQIYAI